MFRLILVEDEPRILRYLKEKATSLSSDFKVVGMYNNGEDALVELHWTQPHALITDIRMPIMDGLTLIGKVRERQPDIQCAIISGHDDFPYLREAIKLGITDYLLKPTADEEFRDLLMKMKDKLMLDQALLEREVAKQLTENPDLLGSHTSTWREIAQELFYHGNYVVVYAWSPVGDLAHNVQSACTDLLADGEKCTPLPAAAGNEEILLFGLHSWSRKRQTEWINAISRLVKAEEGVTVTAALSAKGLQPVPALLEQCRRQARVNSRFDGSWSWVSDETAEEAKPRFEELQPALLRLAQYVAKQQKQLFVKELDALFTGAPGSSATRSEWEYMLLHVSHSLHSMAKDSFQMTFDHKQAMEAEISEEVWKARKQADLVTHIKELWGAYFFKNEQDAMLHRDWAKEAQQYLHDHFHQNVSLTSIADVFELHPAYLNRLFKRSFHSSIPDYLTKLRIDEACRFIREHPFVLIKEIAEHVGYTDPFYFSKVFKQHTGLSPSDYKNSGK